MANEIYKPFQEWLGGLSKTQLVICKELSSAGIRHLCGYAERIMFERSCLLCNIKAL